MAWSEVKTLLPLDEYAKTMAIPGWLFNQVTHPQRVIRGPCNDLWYQSGYFIDPNKVVGRDEIAQAIAVAEGQILGLLRYSPAPTYFCDDERTWPRPKRGIQTRVPIIRSSYGQLIEFGTERWDLLETNHSVVYTDVDNDGVLDTATVTIDLSLYGLTCAANECQIEITPTGFNPALGYYLRMLNRVCSGTTLVLTGWRWLFVEPIYWNRPLELQLNNDNYFVGHDIYPYEGGVDIYRHYTDPVQQADIVWNEDACGAPCVEVCQHGCATVVDRRLGQLTVQPAAYSEGAWSGANWRLCQMPNKVRLWYRAGYMDNQCVDCSGMGYMVKEAIVRLANTHLPEAPCGCDPTRERWNRDREEMSIDSTDVELAQSAFGTTMRGAIFAFNVISKLPPLGKGG